MTDMDKRNRLIGLIRGDPELAVECVEAINSYDGWFDDLRMEPFDDGFFETFFQNNPIEAARATYFGDIQSWNDDYIGFDAYGNLYSRSRMEYEGECVGRADEIADHLLDIFWEADLDYISDELNEIMDDDEEE